MKRLLDWLRPEPKLCAYCRHRGSGKFCQRRVALSLVTGEYELIFANLCSKERSLGYIKSILAKECGKSGRFYEPME